MTRGSKGRRHADPIEGRHLDHGHPRLVPLVLDAYFAAAGTKVGDDGRGERRTAPTLLDGLRGSPAVGQRRAAG